MVRGKLLALFLIPCIILVGCTGQSEPNAEQMKADLIGHRLQVAGSSMYWDFAALSEFEYLDIRSKQMQGGVIEYDVSIRLHDLSTDNHFLADALIVYRQIDGKWKLTSIVPKLFKPL